MKGRKVFLQKLAEDLMCCKTVLDNCALTNDIKGHRFINPFTTDPVNALHFAILV